MTKDEVSETSRALKWNLHILSSLSGKVARYQKRHSKVTTFNWKVEAASFPIAFVRSCLYLRRNWKKYRISERKNNKRV